MGCCFGKLCCEDDVRTQQYYEQGYEAPVTAQQEAFSVPPIFSVTTNALDLNSPTQDPGYIASWGAIIYADARTERQSRIQSYVIEKSAPTSCATARNQTNSQASSGSSTVQGCVYGSGSSTVQGHVQGSGSSTVQGRVHGSGSSTVQGHVQGSSSSTGQGCVQVIQPNVGQTETKPTSVDRNRTNLKTSFQGNTHSTSHLKALLMKATNYVHNQQRGYQFERISYFYRDQTVQYYNHRLQNKGGLMEVCLKDHHGDPKSPINGRLMGIFFSVNVSFIPAIRKSEPVPFSVYGERRLLIDAVIIYEMCPKLYFTDFYCIHNPHYVTLVMTRPNSEADVFCRQYLVQLDWTDNPFLRRTTDGIFMVTKATIWIEVLVTENININQIMNRGGRWDDVEMRGKRSGGNHGLRKKAQCDTCNV